MAHVQDVPTRTERVASALFLFATACALLAFGGFFATWAEADADQMVGYDLVGVVLGVPAALGLLLAGMGFLGRKDHPRTALALGIVGAVLTILPGYLGLGILLY